MEKLFNQQNINFILGLIGSIYALYSIIRNWIKNKENYKITSSKILKLETGVLVYLSIQNNSYRNLIINSAILKFIEDTPANHISKNVVFEAVEVKKGLECIEKIPSSSLPITIPPLSAQGHIICFDYETEIQKDFPQFVEILLCSRRLYVHKIDSSHNLNV